MSDRHWGRDLPFKSNVAQDEWPNLAFNLAGKYIVYLSILSLSFFPLTRFTQRVLTLRLKGLLRSGAHLGKKEGSGKWWLG